MKIARKELIYVWQSAKKTWTVKKQKACCCVALITCFMMERSVFHLLASRIFLINHWFINYLSIYLRRSSHFQSRNQTIFSVLFQMSSSFDTQATMDLITFNTKTCKTTSVLSVLGHQIASH